MYLFLTHFTRVRFRAAHCSQGIFSTRFSMFFRSTRRRTNRTTRQRRRHGFRLRVEPLEDRRLLLVQITADSDSDSFMFDSSHFETPLRHLGNEGDDTFTIGASDLFADFRTLRFNSRRIAWC
jgi:hypothetical protein